MTTTRLYKSTDTSAPVLVGGVSSLINVLDKCLVAGYGSKTAAGWTKPFTGTNAAAFRNSVAAGGTGMYLRVVDSAAGYATARVYETMSSVSSGSNVAPHASTMSNGVFWSKSVTSDSTPRPWWLIADELTFYLFVQADPPGTYVHDSVFGAGDIVSEIASDPWRYFVLGRTDSSHAGAGGVGGGGGLMIGTESSYANPARSSTESLWLGRNRSAASGAVNVRVMVLGTMSGAAVGSDAGSALVNPSPSSSHEYWHQAWIPEGGTLRGRLRGIYLPISALGSTATGAARDDMPWAPTGSKVIVGRHSTNSIYAAYGGDALAGYGVETALEWD